MAMRLALYGNVKIPSIYCRECQRWAFVIGGVKQCCDQPTIAVPTKLKRMSQPAVKRLRPLKADRDRLLAQYGWACAYCERQFDAWVSYHGKPKQVKLAWDHQTAWIHTYNNRQENFLPSCQFCNGWKSSKIFKDMEEVKVYVHQCWQEDKEKFPASM